MPGSNGVDLFSKIKEINPDLPVALMTAYARDELVQRGLDEGVIGVFSKPLDLTFIFEFLAYIGSPEKILLIDDDEILIKLMIEVHNLFGYKNVVGCSLKNYQEI